VKGLNFKRTNQINNGAAVDLRQTMSWKLWIRAAEILVTAVLAISLTTAWRAERADRARLAGELASAKQSLTQADDRQHTRDSQLLQTLATLAIDKRNVTTPTQIIRELPQYLNLPTPLTLQPSSPSQAPSQPPTKPDTQADTSPSTTAPPKNRQQGQVIIPAEDLKPLYDFTLDCKACQARLSATQADLTDEKAKTATLTKERNEAITAAKGGSIVRRITQAAKWLAIGAAAGAIAARAHH
jgi:hypothetical protein